MLVNTIVCLVCTFLSKQFIILIVGYKWSHCLSCFPSASSWIEHINSDSLAVQISTGLVKRVKRHDCLTFDIGLVKRVKRHDCLTFDIGYFMHVHVGLMGGLGDVYIDVTFPW